MVVIAMGACGALLAMWMGTRKSREVTIDMAPRPTMTAIYLGFEYEDIKITLEDILGSLEVPVTAKGIVAADMSLLDWVNLRTRNKKRTLEESLTAKQKTVMRETRVWVLAFHTETPIERDPEWARYPLGQEIEDSIDANATAVGSSVFRNPATGGTVGVAVFSADIGELLETGVYSNSPSSTDSPEVDIYAEIDALDPNNEYDRDGILRMIQSRIDVEQPGMSIQDVAAKKMKLSDYYEKIDHEDNGMTVEDLMPSDQALDARATDVWVVGFRTQDEIDKIGGWFIVPPLSPTLESVPSTIFGADGKAVGLMVFDSRTGECIAANLTPSDWIDAEIYDRLVGYGP